MTNGTRHIRSKNNAWSVMSIRKNAMKSIVLSDPNALEFIQTNQATRDYYYYTGSNRPWTARGYLSEDNAPLD